MSKNVNDAVIWCSLKVLTLSAVAMDPLNTLERLSIALDAEKQGQS
jgi:hypothetical protein